MMDSMRNHLLTIVGVCVLFCGGCHSNPYAENFHSAIAAGHLQTSEYALHNLAAYAGAPTVERAKDTQANAIGMWEDGFILLGTSRWVGPAVAQDLALQEASTIGAQVVTIDAQYQSTGLRNVPITNTRFISRSGTAYGPGGAVTYYDNSTVQDTKWLTETQDNYRHYAAYWTKPIRPQPLGALVENLTVAQRQALGTNSGVSVQGIVRESPAFQNDILPGDVITKINSDRVSGVDSFMASIRQHAGQVVTLMVLRKGQSREMSITLNSDPW